MLPGSQTIVQLKYHELPESLQLEEVRSWHRNPYVCVCPGLMLRHAPKMPNNFVRGFWTEIHHGSDFFPDSDLDLVPTFLSKMDVLKLH